MEVVIRIETDNEAFDGSDLRPELVAVLQRFINLVEGGHSLEQNLRDSNGNKVGEVSVR